jgi:hypothetical protein
MAWSSNLCRSRFASTGVMTVTKMFDFELNAHR